jgi:ArsR family transcriptional regulator
MERLFQALGDSTRLRILGLLQAGEVCVCDIHDSLKISQPKASRHLAYLKKAGLVEARREGLWMYYRLTENTDPVVDTVRQVVTHTLSHVDSVRRDAGRLEKKTGCCLPDAASTSLKCCAGSSSRATS